MKPERKDVPPTGALSANESNAIAWLGDFEKSATYSALSVSIRESLSGAIRVMARCFTRCSSHRGDASLHQITADETLDLLTERLPRNMTTADPDAIAEGLTEFLVWAAKTNRIQNRDVEYACRKCRRDAAAAMTDARKRSPGASIVMDALAAGIDPDDLARVREHALHMGFRPSFVDEFLPPGPTYLGNGGWLWLSA